MRMITAILKCFPYLAGQAELLHQIVNTDETVLLTGPTGVGKSRLAGPPINGGHDMVEFAFLEDAGVDVPDNAVGAGLPTPWLTTSD